MLSKEMYDLLVKVPRFPKSIYAGKLYENNPMYNRIRDLLCEAAYKDYDYINHSESQILKSNISLTEKGQAALEEYEAFDRNQKITRRSLTVAIVAMIASIASAVAAIASLIKMLI